MICTSVLASHAEDGGSNSGRVKPNTSKYNIHIKRYVYSVYNTTMLFSVNGESHVKIPRLTSGPTIRLNEENLLRRICDLNWLI